jgi:hypothetical protein
MIPIFITLIPIPDAMIFAADDYDTHDAVLAIRTPRIATTAYRYRRYPHRVSHFPRKMQLLPLSSSTGFYSMRCSVSAL